MVSRPETTQATSLVCQTEYLTYTADGLVERYFGNTLIENNLFKKKEEVKIFKGISKKIYLIQKIGTH